MKITRRWAMPSGNTFEVKPIRDFVWRHMKSIQETADPFARDCQIAKHTNDLDPSTKAKSNMDALSFLKTFDDSSIDGILFDPPYSPRQVSECYKNLGLTVNMETTQSSFWSNIKDEISRVLKPHGVVLCFGWNSQGLGKNRGFEMVEILIVAHGGQHNDTICTAEIKKPTLFNN